MQLSGWPLDPRKVEIELRGTAYDEGSNARRAGLVADEDLDTIYEDHGEEGNEGWEDDNEALKAASNLKVPASKGKDKGKGLSKKKFPNITCFSCNEKGHYANECPNSRKSANTSDVGEKDVPESEKPSKSGSLAESVGSSLWTFGSL